MNDGLIRVQGINLRQDILDLIPYREALTTEEISDLIKDNYKFASRDKFFKLKYRVAIMLDSLVKEGILETNTKILTNQVTYLMKHKYLAGRDN